MKLALVLLFAAFCALLAVPASAQQKSDLDSIEQRFKQLDKNGDGKITTDEVPMSPFFKHRDINGDGVITLAELKAGAAPPVTLPAPGNPKTAAESTAKSKVSQSAIIAKPRPK